MMKRRELLKTFLVVPPVAVLIGCTANQILTSLTAVAAAAQIAVPVILGAVGVPAPLVSVIMGYLAAVSQGVSQATSIIMAAPVITPQIVAQIVALFAMVLAPALPPGTPAVIVGAVEAVATALATFLGQLVRTVPPPPTTPAAGAASESPRRIAVSAAGLTASYKLSSRDQKEVSKAQQTANDTVKTIRAAGY